MRRMNAEPKKVSNIKQLTSQECNNIEKGDIVIKEDSTGGHAYICTFKKDGVGMCLTYTDASCVETISYDFIDGAWVYNSMDLTHLQNFEHLSEDETGVVVDGTLKVEKAVDIGDETTADSPKIILHSTPASNQGDWAIYTTGNQQFLYFEQIGQNSGIKMSRSSILPGSHNYVSLGNSQFAFKDLVLRGNIDFGSSSNIKLNSANNKVEITNNGVLTTRFAQSQVECNVNLIPTGNNQMDLGSQSNQWRDLYVSGKVILSGLPTSDPQVEGQLWNDNGVLKISAGE